MGKLWALVPGNAVDWHIVFKLLSDIFEFFPALFEQILVVVVDALCVHGDVLEQGLASVHAQSNIKLTFLNLVLKLL